ncbi:hypothetical protein EDB92DRAFT_441376 [Lactarius akahatsu]|uniref:Uncharacterized protein n=1 Tax=Lactarius akahatsu TaxID=416441 RepID=A0AAD4LIL8_9AGAM|nr:hypothetical protein EDB92DRAFT_441376 [Lactarius akahatsu]
MLSTHRLWSLTKSVYLRITLNWVTISFFCFSFIHCFAQGTLQSFLFSADDSWGSFTSAIVDHAQINATTFLSSAETQILATISTPWVRQNLFQSHVVFCVQTPLSAIRAVHLNLVAPPGQSNAVIALLLLLLLPNLISPQTSVAWAVTGTKLLSTNPYRLPATA